MGNRVKEDPDRYHLPETHLPSGLPQVILGRVVDKFHEVVVDKSFNNGSTLYTDRIRDLS
jgi:hypothetical protein